MARASFSFQGATVRRPGRTIMVACAAMLLPCIGFVVVAAGAPQWIRSLVGIVAVSEAFLLLLLATVFPRVFWGAGKSGASRVDVDERGLLLDGRLAMAHADVSSVSMATGADGHAHVVVAGTGRLSTLDIDVSDRGVATALARSLDADSALPSFWVESEPLWPERKRRRLFSRFLVATPLFALTLFVVTKHVRSVVPVGYVPISIAYAFVLSRRAAPVRASVGADGIALRPRGEAPTFIPFSNMRQVERTARGACFTVDGRSMELRVAGVDATVDAQASTLGDALVTASRDAASCEHDPVEHRLDRAKRSARDWLAEIRSLQSARGRGYREVALADERLLRIVESPAAPSAARAAAALLVANGLPEEGRDRVRQAASRAATPGLRDVMEAALRDAPEQELEVLLERAAS